MYKLYFKEVNDIKDIALPRNVLNHVNSYKIESKKKESYLGYSLLCEGLKDFNVYDFDVDFTVKPTLIGCDLFFSISHDNGMALVAISDSNIGVDLMNIRDISNKLIELILNINEKVPTSPDEATLLWCKKEAAYKYDNTIYSLKDIDTTKYIYDVNKKDGYIIVVCYGKI